MSKVYFNFDRLTDSDKVYNKFDYLVTSDKEDQLLNEYHTYCHRNDYGGKSRFDLDKIKDNEYIINSVRICLSTLYTICNCSRAARLVYITLLYKLHKVQNVINITVEQIKKFSKLTNEEVNRGLNELKEKELIEEIDETHYKIPIIDLYKGNSWDIIQQMETNYMRKHR